MLLSKSVMFCDIGAPSTPIHPRPGAHPEPPTGVRGSKCHELPLRKVYGSRPVSSAFYEDTRSAGFADNHENRLFKRADPVSA